MGIFKITYFNETNESYNNINLFESVQKFTIEGNGINHKYQVQFQLTNILSHNFLTETVISHTNIITFNTCYICDFFLKNSNHLISL